jgi:hypothetical protein
LTGAAERRRKEGEPFDFLRANLLGARVSARIAGYGRCMEDLVKALSLAVGLETVFFVLLMVMGRLEPEQPRESIEAPTQVVRKPSTAGALVSSEEDDTPRAA